MIRSRLKDSLGLRRNIVVMLTATLLLGMGEELWVRFVPKYLEVLGAGAWGIGAYGVLKDFLDRRGSRSHLCALGHEREGSMHHTRPSSRR